MDGIEEVVPFLGDKNAKVRLLAAERVATLSANEAAIPRLQKTKAASLLCARIGDQILLKEMIASQVVARVIESVSNATAQEADHFIMLLSNVTRLSEGALKLLQVGEALHGLRVAKLVELFTRKVDAKDTFAGIAGILCNITQTKEGRDLFLDKSKSLLLKLIPYMLHQNKVRQRGVLGLIRNTLFESEAHQYLLGKEVDLLPKLLFPLLVSGEYDEEELKALPPQLRSIPGNQTFEADDESRALLIDCLTLLTSTKAGRDYLREKQAHAVIREYEKREKNDELHTKVVNLVDVLKGLDPSSLVGTTIPLEVVPDDEEPTPPPLPRKVVLRDELGDIVEEI